MKNKTFDAGLEAYEDIFASTDIAQKGENWLVQQISVDLLHDFPGHTFKVIDDEDMEELCSLIKNYGILEPLVAKTGKDGGYITIVGHRRKYCAKKLGLTEVPVIVRDELDDDQAATLMIISNKHRTHLLPSEKAKSYRLLWEIENRQGKRNDLALRQDAAMLKNAKEALAKEEKLGIRQIQRYIRLTNLIPSFLDLVDEGTIPLMVGYELSFLSEEGQEKVLAILESLNTVPTVAQAKSFAAVEKAGELSYEMITKTLHKPKLRKSFTIKQQYISEYFPEEFTKEEIENVIVELLEQWKKSN